MRRFGGREDFLDLCERIRALAPEAGIRSNVIVGFPGETEDDLAELEAFLEGARLDAVGVFGYSDEDGTEAAGFDGKLPAEEIAARVERITALTQELMAQRAEDRVGTEVTVLVEAAEDDDFECTGRAATRPRRSTASASSNAGPAWPSARWCGRWWSAPKARTSSSNRASPCPAARSRAPGRRGVSAGTSGVPPPGPPPPLLNIANVLTGVRLLLVPVFLLTLFADAGQNTAWRYAATGVFVIAAITDRFDGELARSRGLVTAFGTLADPIADKALTGAALVGLSVLQLLPWWVTVVIMGRELGITLLRFLVLRHGIIAASRGGKAKTLVQMIAIGLYLLPMEGVSSAVDGLRWAVMAVAVGLTVVTGLDYLVKALRPRSRTV